MDIMTNNHNQRCHQNNHDDRGHSDDDLDDIQPAAVQRLCAWSVQRQVAQLHHRFKSGSRRMLVVMIIVGDMIVLIEIRKLVQTEKVQGN